MADYRAAAGLCHAQANALLRSPAHWLARYGPDALEPAASKAQRLGAALHTLVLEPQQFEARYCSKDARPARPTVASLRALAEQRGLQLPRAIRKAELEALLAQEAPAPDPRITLSADEHKQLQAMAEALRCHPLTSAWFTPEPTDAGDGQAVSLFVQHPLADGGVVPLKGRLDRLILDPSRQCALILDLKSCCAATAHEFAAAAVSCGYDLQASWSRHLVQCLHPGLAVEVLMIAIEKQAPHGIAIYRASEAMLASGQQKMALAIERFCNGQRSGQWPGYQPLISDLQHPAWSRR